MEIKLSGKRGRPQAEYRCAVSGKICPFNGNVWEMGDARDIAHSECPAKSYSNSDYTRPDGTKVYSDFCKHLIPREK